MKRCLTICCAIVVVLFVALLYTEIVVPARTQAELVTQLKDSYAIAKARDYAGNWLDLSSNFEDNVRYSISRVDLEFDGLECENLKTLLPLLQQLPNLKELHLPAWMSDEFIRKHLNLNALTHIKRIYDIPYPA
jgi:hypothetical protein